MKTIPFLVEVHDANELHRWKPAHGMQRLDGAHHSLDSADMHWAALDGASQLVGCCSLWWTNVPAYPGQCLGLIGHYNVSHSTAAGRLLERACAELREQGCTMAVGPMGGSTWRNYRFVTEDKGDPRFFLEPQNPLEWPEQFLGNGFHAMAHYYSSLADNLLMHDPKVSRAEERLSRIGVTLRNLKSVDLKKELRRIYHLICKSFCRGFLYHPLSEIEFFDDMRRLEPFLEPELCWIADCNKGIVGFLFGIPDWLEIRSGRSNTTAVIKTLAISPEREYGGLGSLLVERMHRSAYERGYRRIIHALMHESNRSRNISARYGKPFRRYTLYGRRL